MFTGRFEHTLDDKGRMAIPSPFRRRLAVPEAGGEGEVSVFVNVSDGCLAAYSQQDYQAKLDNLAKLNQFDPKVMAIKRIFVGSAAECPIDKAGRILIPANLRTYGGIERDAVIVGQIDKFEIWSAERWEKTFNQLSDQVGSLYASLAESGIQI